MKNWLQDMNDRFRRFMIGRYGSDELARCTLTVSLVFFVLSFFVGRGLLYILGLAGLIYTYFRMFSKDYAKRRAENAWFLEKTGTLRKSFRIQKRRFEERKEFHYFKCPNCSQQVRVPRGKGHIRITCPKCRTQFDKTT
ncbi:MAG: hypothetical protein Q4B09_11190 [Lachnospiraceae bacterium]|nr:hypothetical protein [Lachnospiraceae bacterium]